VLQTFRTAQAHGVTPDLPLWNRVLNACSLSRDVQNASQIFSEIENSDSDPDIITYNTMMSAHVRVGDMDGALAIFDSMHVGGVEATSRTYDTLMRGFMNANRWNDAGGLWDKMQSCSVQPSEFTYGLLFQVSCLQTAAVSHVIFATFFQINAKLHGPAGTESVWNEYLASDVRLPARACYPYIDQVLLMQLEVTGVAHRFRVLALASCIGRPKSVEKAHNEMCWGKLQLALNEMISFSSEGVEPNLLGSAQRDLQIACNASIAAAVRAR
jgi:pentatricopeptide repeat protein